MPDSKGSTPIKARLTMLTNKELRALCDYVERIKPLYYLPGLTLRQQNAIRQLSILTHRAKRKHNKTQL